MADQVLHSSMRPSQPLCQLAVPAASGFLAAPGRVRLRRAPHVPARAQRSARAADGEAGPGQDREGWAGTAEKKAQRASPSAARNTPPSGREQAVPSPGSLLSSAAPLLTSQLPSTAEPLLSLLDRVAGEAAAAEREAQLSGSRRERLVLSHRQRRAQSIPGNSSSSSSSSSGRSPTYEDRESTSTSSFFDDDDARDSTGTSTPSANGVKGRGRGSTSRDFGDISSTTYGDRNSSLSHSPSSNMTAARRSSSTSPRRDGAATTRTSQSGTKPFPGHDSPPFPGSRFGTPSHFGSASDSRESRAQGGGTPRMSKDSRPTKKEGARRVGPAGSEVRQGTRGRDNRTPGDRFTGKPTGESRGKAAGEPTGKVRGRAAGSPSGHGSRSSNAKAAAKSTELVIPPLPGGSFPFHDFVHSYSETPKVAPIGYREPIYSPFGPVQMKDRPHTGGAPLSRGRGSGRVSGYSTEQNGTEEYSTAEQSAEAELRGDAWTKAHPGMAGAKDWSGGAIEGGGAREGERQGQEAVWGAPLSREEVEALVAECLKEKRQVNLGRDGLVHNMLELIHTHWKRRRVCRVKCKGVPTVDMDNVVATVEERTGGKVIHRQGGVLYVFRGRHYAPKLRPKIPLMLWKPPAPIYPKLIQEAPEGLTREEANVLRIWGRRVPAVCRLAKNGVYSNLVQVVRDRFQEHSLVKVDCRGLDKSDFKKIGAKLKDLVPCVLLSFERDQILMWQDQPGRPRPRVYANDEGATAGEEATAVVVETAAADEDESAAAGEDESATGEEVVASGYEEDSPGDWSVESTGEGLQDLDIKSREHAEV